ncbi:MAG: G/U mismatch-specific DNA glycosylase [Streptosporangiaceae bacterium]
MRPTAEQLRAAADLVIPDILPEPGTRFAVLFCGINPGLYSGATGHHFARPGNRFWPALHRSGFTERQLRPDEQDLLGAAGLGITNLAPRTTARADELTPAELKAGGEKLAALVADRRPAFLAVAGVTAYRTAFGRRKAAIGAQNETLGTTRIWVLPNPSGLNAGWSLDRMVGEFGRLRRACGWAGSC